MMVQLGRGRLRPVAAITLACASLISATALGSIFLRTSLDAWTTVTAPGPAGPADGILLITGLCGTLLSLWLGLGMTLSALSALPGALGLLCRGLARRVAPVAVRKVVAFLLGTTLTAALVPGTALAGIDHGTADGAAVATAQKARPSTPSGVAVAAPDASFRLVSDRSPEHTRVAVRAVPAVPGIPAVQALGAVRIPTEPAMPVVPAARASTDAAPPPAWLPEPAPSLMRPAIRANAYGGTEAVVVLRGDTLWSIAARHLGHTASAADIQVEWHRWLAANRDVIGDDADLILPGQLLSPPPTKGAGS